MTPDISINEAAHRLHRSPEETLALLRDKAFAGHPELKFPTVDPVSLDQYIQNNRHPAQRPLIPANAEEIAARAAWSEPEEAVIRDAPDRYAAIAEYRLEFVNSRRTDYAVGKHWYRMRGRKPGMAGRIWSFVMAMALSFFRRKKAGV